MASNNIVAPNNDQEDREKRMKDLVVYDDAKQLKKKEQTDFWKWITEMFFSGKSLKNIVLDVVKYDIVPNAKDNVRNALVSFIDQGLYPDNQSSSPNTQKSGSFITNYVQFGNSKKPANNSAVEENKKKDDEIVKNGFTCPAFADRRRAIKFISDLKAYANKYTKVTVFDLAVMQGKHLPFTWEKYGWYTEEIIKLNDTPKRINNSETPFVIEMPPAHEFDD